MGFLYLFQFYVFSKGIPPFDGGYTLYNWGAVRIIITAINSPKWFQQHFCGPCCRGRGRSSAAQNLAKSCLADSGFWFYFLGLKLRVFRFPGNLCRVQCFEFLLLLLLFCFFASLLLRFSVVHGVFVFFPASLLLCFSVFCF